MFKTKPHSCILHSVNSSYNSHFEIPIICPHCNYSIQPVIKKSRLLSYGSYLKEINIDTSAADVIRVLGNDYTHYERRYDDIDFIVVKKYLEIFMQQIETKLLLMEPIIPVNR